MTTWASSSCGDRKVGTLGTLGTVTDSTPCYFSAEHITGQQVSQIMNNNGTVRIFEVLGRKRAQEARRAGDNTLRLKERLMSEYSKPGPIPPGKNSSRLK